MFTTPVNSAVEIVRAAEGALKKVFKPGIHYKRGGVMVPEISSERAIQPDLFEYDAEMSRKYKTISDAIDEINEKLGADTVILASQQYLRCDETGKSVRFSHAIKRALLSPDYSTSPSAFLVR